MALNKRKRGAKGEDIAADHLNKKGYRIVLRNYNCPLGEMDIIAFDGDCLVFIEVRSRWSDRFGTPEESITKDKVARLTKIGRYYLAKEIRKEVPCRFDFIGIMLDNKDNVIRLNHLENIID